MMLEGNYFDPETWEAIDESNLFFNAIYILEFIFKIIGLGVIAYFTDFNHYLDFSIVALCILDFAFFHPNFDISGKFPAFLINFLIFR